MVVENFTTPGSHNWLVPPNVFAVDLVECVPGGAGGGRGAGSTNGGGGGGQVYASKANIPVTPGTTIPIVVGTGQAGATSSTPNPAAATDSSFNTNVVVADAGLKGDNGALANAGDQGAAGLVANSVGDTKVAGGGGVANTSAGGTAPDLSGVPSATLIPGAPGGAVTSGAVGNPGTAPGGAGGGGSGSGNTDGGAGANGAVRLTYTPVGGSGFLALL